jgi:DNA polymerase-3 subunit delta
MTPDQFLDRLKKSGPAPAYLFLGPEAYQRERCRKALLAAALPPEALDDGLTRHDLDEIPLASVLDDARSMSLFASKRVIWVASAEAALPRGKMDEGEAAELAAYLKDPTPDTVIVIESSRYDFEGEDKARIERVQKYYACVPAQVEFRPFDPSEARALAQSLAKKLSLQLGLGELALLLEATGGDAARLAVEIEKLSLYAGTARKVTAEDIAELVPDAQQTTVFALVSALGRGDRRRALDVLDTLAREGEYMPLALTFLATQFRMAQRKPDSGALQQTGSEDLAGKSTADRANGDGVSQIEAGASGGPLV